MKSFALFLCAFLVFASTNKQNVAEKEKQTVCFSWGNDKTTDEDCLKCSEEKNKDEWPCFLHKSCLCIPVEVRRSCTVKKVEGQDPLPDSYCTRCNVSPDKSDYYYPQCMGICDCDPPISLRH